MSDPLSPKSNPAAIPPPALPPGASPRTPRPREEFADFLRTAVARCGRASLRVWMPLDRRRRLLVVCAGFAAVALPVLVVAWMSKEPGYPPERHPVSDPAVDLTGGTSGVPKAIASPNRPTNDRGQAVNETTNRNESAASAEPANVTIPPKNLHGRNLRTGSKSSGFAKPANTPKDPATGRAAAIDEKTRKGMEALEKRDWDLAIAELTEAIQHDPTNTTAYCGRACAYFENGKYQWTVADCTSAIQLDSRCATAYAVRGKAYCVLEQWPKAMTSLDEAVRLAPKSAEAHYLRGCTLASYARSRLPSGAGYFDLSSEDHTLGKTFRNAIDEFEVAIRLDPAHPSAAKYLDIIREEMGHWHLSTRRD